MLYASDSESFGSKMILTDYILKLIDKIASQEGLLDYTLETDVGSKCNDNINSQLIAIKMTGTKKIGKTIQSVTYNLLCKIPSPNLLVRNVCQTVFAFQREIEMYSKVIPALIQFQKDKGLPLNACFVSCSKVLFTCFDKANDHLILFMNDLRAKGFKMFPKERCTDIEHATLMLTELAKFHDFVCI